MFPCWCFYRFSYIILYNLYNFSRVCKFCGHVDFPVIWFTCNIANCFCKFCETVAFFVEAINLRCFRNLSNKIPKVTDLSAKVSRQIWNIWLFSEVHYPIGKPRTKKQEGNEICVNLCDILLTSANEKKKHAEHTAIYLKTIYHRPIRISIGMDVLSRDISLGIRNFFNKDPLSPAQLLTQNATRTLPLWTRLELLNFLYT